MGQYYNAVTQDKDGKMTVYSMQTTKWNGRNYDEYNGLKLTEHSWWKNDFCKALSEKLVDNPMKVAWVGDYSEKEELIDAGIDVELFKSTEEVKIEPSYFSLDSVAFLVNLDKKQFVDLKKYKERSNDDGWTLYPLSILTAIGNGRGGGDYRHDDLLVGSWAFDTVYFTNELPQGLEEIEPEFHD